MPSPHIVLRIVKRPGLRLLEMYQLVRHQLVNPIVQRLTVAVGPRGLEPQATQSSLRMRNGVVLDALCACAGCLGWKNIRLLIVW